MIDAAFVLPLTTFGMTLASATQPFDAHHAELRVDAASHPAGRRDVVDGQRVVTREVLQQRIARDAAFDMPVFFGKKRWDQQRSDRSMPRPVGHDVEATTNHREPDFFSSATP